MEEIAFETILVSREDKVATVTLNRPESANAFTRQLVRELGQVLVQIAADEKVRAVILTGAGTAFSAGGDVNRNVNTLGQMTRGEFNNFFGELEELFFIITSMEKPVIAAINGAAMAGGLELALVCDVRIAAEGARFGVLFVLVGLAPEVCLFHLTRLIGLAKAKYLSMTGRVIDAREAERLGLIDSVVTPDQLQAKAKEMAHRLANGPIAVGLIKKAYNETAAMDFRSSMGYAKELMYQIIHTHDYQEGITAFLEKRPPAFQGR